VDTQLKNVRHELQEATSRALQLVERLPDTTWGKTPDRGGWSVAQCIMHLNKSTEGYLPRLDAAIGEGRRRNLTGPGPFRRDFPGWLLCRFVEPPYRIKVRTPATFDPQRVDSAEIVMEAWMQLQGQLYGRIAAADGLALDKVKVVSPFAESVKYNLLSAFTVIPAHQRRHIWQAEQILRNDS
jgi:hypothetical protein